MTDTISSHYASRDIAQRLLAALRAAHGPDAPVTPDSLAPLDHFHGRGLEATKEMVHALQPRSGEHLIDIGCGIGGPARWIATTFGCRVTGVDLTPDFVAAGVALTEACGLSDRVQILQGSALALPVPEAAFDRAYSQNVLMNIADKAGFYREALRVLKPGGLLAVTAIASGPGGPPHFPVPWASVAEASFLNGVADMRAEIAASGFELVAFREIPPTPGQIEQRKRMESGNLPALGIHVLMGERFRQLQVNSARSAEEGRVIATEYLLRKPA